MKEFMGEHFLLQSEVSRRLYHDYAAGQPIIDYHCHLNPQEIYEDKRFGNLAEIWLYGDHYKWRAMRANGIEEALVTGGPGVDDYDRFLAWARTVPATLGNPLYHWSHLELRRYFGIEEPINEKNAPAIWEKANAVLRSEDFSVRKLIRDQRVRVICTTDDPTDTLEYHEGIKGIADFDCLVLPSFRPDKGLEIRRGTFVPWVRKLGETAGTNVDTYEGFLAAVDSRIAFFAKVGCKVSDHALDRVLYAETNLGEVSDIYARALGGETLTLEEESKYKTYTLLHLGEQYSKLGWTMQLHIHASRNNNSRTFSRLGPDTGFDSIHDGELAYPLTKLLDGIDAKAGLPRTILYSLNPKDYYVLGTVMGSFQGGGIPGKIQLGSAWWFNDTKDGMLEQMNALANLGLLSRFVGMLTDSRSFLSYPRHEYFRRILCDMLGEWVERGEAPHDMELLGGMVEDICFRNAQNYFGF
ncbi:glucuronate isomerase [Cohnella sp. CIP 111063]|uniref:glucuronate isomerase n=1 Tax=unclassified Cohnella TaxID=2636738 RepID=UPI000B8C428A|nr:MULTISPECIES: glucuronate isomerase [unclassified Cohnella]OXS53863.1 glucuronate isomerase [Cohnella sp. CIP 111063]PRX62447.1 glucuronate isomerase [Cohnella sp. SGD-V74]